jgi:hypothetical protein
MKKLILASVILLAHLAVNPFAHGLDLDLSTDEDGNEITDSQYTTLIMGGVIEPGDASRVDNILRRRFRQGGRTVFMLTSPGGVLEEVDPLARVIVSRANQFYMKYKRPLLFVVNQECDSACGVLTAALTKYRGTAAIQPLEILIQKDSSFFFHHPKEMRGGRVVDYQDRIEAIAAYNRLVTAYLNYGVSLKWINHQRDMFDRGQGFTLSAADLCLEESGVVPADSCTALDADELNEKIDEVMTRNGFVMLDIEVRKSIVRGNPLKVFRSLHQLFEQ